MRVNFSKYNLKIGVREEFLPQLSVMIFEDLGVTHIKNEYRGDMKSLEHYFGDHVARSENTVYLRTPVQLESKMHLPSSNRSIIFDYSFNGRDTATLGFYQMRSDLLINKPTAAPTIFSPVDVDAVLKKRGVQYTKTPDKFFTIFSSQNYVEKVAAPPKPQVVYRKPAPVKPVPVVKRIEKRPEPAKAHAAKIVHAPKPRKFYRERVAVRQVKVPTPLYSSVNDLNRDERKIISTIELLGGQVGYSNVMKTSGMDEGRYKCAFQSLLDRGLTKKFVQGNNETYDLTYRK
jgi:hypothetical protein